MGFDDRARAAGRLARLVGAQSERPDLAAVAVARRRRQYVAWGLAGATAVVLGVLVNPGVPQGEPLAASSTTTTAPTTTTEQVAADCQVTIPIGDFTPPSEYPPEPPDLYDAVWHGSDGLWTMVPPGGARWEALPENSPGVFTQKVFWWSAGFDAIEDPHPLLVTATNLVSGEVLEFSGRDVTSGMRTDIGHFMIAGIDLPAGCWELAGSLEGTTTSFVAEIGAGG